MESTAAKQAEATEKGLLMDRPLLVAMAAADEETIRQILLRMEAQPNHDALQQLLQAASINAVDSLLPPLLHAVLRVASQIDVALSESEQIVALFRSAMGKDPPAVRSLAFEGLGEFGGKESASSILIGLDDPDPLVRVSALDALAVASPDRARQLLPTLIKVESDPWTKAAIDAHAFLACITDELPDPTELLEQRFDIAGTFIRVIGEFLGSSLPHRKREQLREFLGRLLAINPDAFVRESAEDVLRELS